MAQSSAASVLKLLGAEHPAAPARMLVPMVSAAPLTSSRPGVCTSRPSAGCAGRTVFRRLKTAKRRPQDDWQQPNRRNGPDKS